MLNTWNWLSFSNSKRYISTILCALTILQTIIGRMSVLSYTCFVGVHHATIQLVKDEKSLTETLKAHTHNPMSIRLSMNWSPNLIITLNWTIVCDAIRVYFDIFSEKMNM